MTPERFQQIEEIFDRAADAEPAERVGLVERLCGEDIALRTEVLALLKAHEGARTNIRAVVGQEVATTLVEANRAMPERLGPFRLERELGRGGMGVVYLALRDDDEYRVHVAIKLLPHALAGADAVARFRDERQYLAALSHPSIVRLLDGGSTDEGLPYLVMEYVEGIPITRWVEEHRLSIRARIELFRQVCGAVAHAHGRLIVHRDIKPSNILVTREGVPKLLDFGIAVLQDPTGGREARTRTGMHLLTPEYASPEQVRGEAPTTSTDVYALGAVLYELLTGALAQKIEGESIEALRAIVEVEPLRPSLAARPEQRRALAGDLDNIVLKALRKESSQRYASVEQFSEDLSRYLDGLPVRARASTFTYRAGKWLRRQKAFVSALAVVFVSLSAATVLSLREARRADRAAQEAKLAAQRADAEAARAKRRFDDVRQLANSLLFEFDRKIANLEGATEARELMTRRALTYLNGLASETSNDPKLALELARAYLQIAQIQGSPQIPNLGQPQEGIVSAQKAKMIIESLDGEGIEGTYVKWTLARTLFVMAELYWAQSDQVNARTWGESAIEIVRSLTQDAQYDYQLAIFMLNLQLSIAMFSEGDTDRARYFADQMIEYATAWTKREPASRDARMWISIGQYARAGSFGFGGDPAAALKDIHEGDASLGALAAEDPDDLRFRRDLWFSKTLQAAWFAGRGDQKIWISGLGDLKEAEKLLREALPIAKTMAENDPKDLRAQMQYIANLEELAAIVGERAAAPALNLFQQSRARFDTLPSQQRDTTYVREYDGIGECYRAVVLAKSARVKEARAAIDRGIELLTRNVFPGASINNRARPSMCRFLAARAMRILGQTSDAVHYVDDATAELRELLKLNPKALLLYTGLGDVLSLRAELIPAERCVALRQVREVWRVWPGPSNPHVKRSVARLDEASVGCPQP